MPAHHPGLVLTDITVKTCNSLNPLSSCKLDPDVWHRIDKDLYLKKGWVYSAYVHIKRKQEAELLPEDKVIVDVSVGKLDTAAGVKGEGDERWESRPAGLWLKRSAKRGASDSSQAVTAVDVLFGADAEDPRDGWQIIGTSLLLDTSGEEAEPRLSIRRGKQYAPTKPIPRINEHGRFKIMQAADLHLSTGTGHCRDEQPEGYNGGKCEADPRTLEFMARLLDEEKPDLVVLSGDQVNGETAPDAQTVSYIFLCCRFLTFSRQYSSMQHFSLIAKFPTLQFLGIMMTKAPFPARHKCRSSKPSHTLYRNQAQKTLTVSEITMLRYLHMGRKTLL